MKGSLFGVAVTPAKMREQLGADHPAGRWLVFLGRGAGRDVSETMALDMSTYDAVERLFAVLRPDSVYVWAAAGEDAQAIGIELMRPGTPGNLVDEDAQLLAAVQREAAQVIDQMMKKGKEDHA